ncbi:glycoside hydrolase family 13 protein [Streptomyces sp. NPDC089919]|uniref:glycoside hydrolase family 13 protein n=1 Tax=Streptomyces sp. NPDC089919 TaxID=3155188 RepID=UPI00341F0D27
MTQELTAARLASASSNPAGAARGWWHDAVVYQVYVRSFADSDGDGIGDLRGVRSRLPHLARLGVDALWLTPFYLSPGADGGYDVADYRTVDPLFGDLADVEELVRAAHELGLRVIVDVVPHHTSDRHRWFREALASPAARDRYHFRPGRGEDGALPPNDWESVFGGPAWSRVPAAGDGADPGPAQWYLHLFAPEQPDLNWAHPEVREEFEAVLRFWLDRGVDGFRIDVAHGMVKPPELPDVGRGGQAVLIGSGPLPFFDQDGVHEIHRSWRRLLDSYDGQRIGVGEAWVPTPERLARYVRPDELHQAFDFRFLNCPWDAAALEEVITQSLAATAAVGAPTTWVLSSHDVVRHRTRYGSLARARAAALLMLALPGSAYLYQGEELGLPEVAGLPAAARRDPAFRRRHPAGAVPGEGAAAADGQDGLRDGCRVPLPWSGTEPPYGFGPEGSWLPQPDDWAALTVEAQTGDPHSTLELYRAALELRRALPGLGAGTFAPETVAPGTPAPCTPAPGTADAGSEHPGMRWLAAPEGVLAFTRPGFVCTVNTRPEPVELPAPGRPVLSSSPIGTDGRTVLVPADSCTWWAI